MKKFLQKNFFWLFFIFTVGLIFHSWITINSICRGDCVYFFPDNLKSFLTIPLSWNTSPVGSGLGYFALPTLTFAPLHFLLGFFQLFGFRYEIIEKIVFYFPFLIFSSLGMIYLSKSLGLSKIGAFFAALFYLANTYILLVVDGGQVGIALAYSLVPIVFLFFIKGLAGGKRDKILAGLLIGVLIFFDLRVAYLAFGLTLFYSLFYLLDQKLKKTISNVIQSLIFFLIIPFGLHLFWIGPLLLSKTIGLSSYYFQSSQVDFLSWMTTLNGLFLFQPHWPTNIFGKIHPVQPTFFILPFLVFLNLLIFRKKKEIFFLVFISLMSIFLIKGSQEPNGEFYKWFFIHFPGFNMFRDPSKFYIPLVFSYSLLLAFTIEWVFGRIKLFNKNLSFVFLGLVFLYFLFLIKPVLLGQMSGTFKPTVVPQDYENIKNLISEDKSFFRSIWYPDKREFSYSSAQHPLLDASLDIFHRRPFDIFIGGTYDIFSYLENPFSRQLFDILGIKYVFTSDSLRPHTLSESELKDKARLLKVLNTTSWLKKTNSIQQVTSFQTKISAEHFFAANQTFWVVGSDSLYQTLDTFSGFRLRNLGLVYLDDLKNFPDSNTWQKPDYLVFNNKEWSDLAFLLADKKYFISPANNIQVNKLPNKSWIVKGPLDFISWRDILAHKAFGNMDFDFGGGFVSADDYPQRLSFSFDLKENINGDLYIRYFANRLGGEFNIKLDGETVKSLKTNSLRDNFVWEKLSSLNTPKGEHVISLENLKGFNAVNVFVFLPRQKIVDWQKQAKEIVNANKTIYFYEPGEATQSGGLNFSQSGKFEIFTQVSPNLKTDNVKVIVNSQILEKPVMANRVNYEWLDLGNVEVNEGTNKVEINPSGIGEIVFQQDGEKSLKELFTQDNNLPTVTYEIIDPTKYLLHIKNVKSPFNLVFSESYHPLWQAEVGNEALKPLPFYSIINGFQVSKTGDFDMVVEFTLQRRALPWLFVSLASFLLTVGFLVFYKKGKND